MTHPKAGLWSQMLNASAMRKGGQSIFGKCLFYESYITDPCYFQELSVSWAESESLINLGMFPQLNPPELRSSHHGPQTQPAFSWRILEQNEDFPAMELPECHY